MNTNTLTDRRTITQNELKMFLTIFVINLLALSPLIVYSHVHYSIDSYGIINNWENVKWYVGCFRYFGAAITSLVSLLGHNPINNPTLDILFYIFSSSISVTFVAYYFCKLLTSLNNKVLITSIVEFSLLITVVNVWYSNILTFPECILFNAFGLSFCFISVYIYSSREGIISRLIAAILFICSAACFQQFIPIFMIYTVLLICVKLSNVEMKGVKSLIILYLKPFLFILINSIIYYVIGVLIQVLMNSVPNSRASMSFETFLANIKYFIVQQHSFLKGRGFFSTEILTICYLLVIVIFLISLAVFWKKTRETTKSVFIGISFVFAYISAYLPGLLTKSHGTRTICALFSVFALLGIGAFALYKNRFLNITLVCVLFVVFALNLYKTVDMGINQIVDNTAEDIYATNVAYAIEKYEFQSGETIDTIGIGYDKNKDARGESLYVDYAIKPLLEMHIDRSITFVEIPKTLCANFSNKDWQNFDEDEQIVFEKNTAYICVY